MVSSTTVRDILCFCPKLEFLHAKSVHARDVVRGGPWACQRLRDLKICFLFGDTERDLQQAIFEHLSKLTQLVSLEMHIPENDWENWQAYGS